MRVAKGANRQYLLGHSFETFGFRYLSGGLWDAAWPASKGDCDQTVRLVRPVKQRGHG